MSEIRKVEYKLQAEGFVPVRHTRHGKLYKHKDGRTTIVGQHYKKGIIPVGTLISSRGVYNSPQR